MHDGTRGPGYVSTLTSPGRAGKNKNHIKENNKERGTHEKS